MAMMAFAAFSFTGCDSDDDSGDVKSAIEQVLGVVDAVVKQGSIPAVTDQVQGLTNHVTKTETSTSIIVTSPVELSKFFIAVAGVDGYLECPAQALSNNASAVRGANSTYSYVVVVAVGDGVSETVKITVNAETVDGTVVSVIKDVEILNSDSGNVGGDAASLAGVWLMKSEDYTTILTLTDKTYSIMEDWDSVAYEAGTYVLEGDIVYMTPVATSSDKNQIEPHKAKIEVYRNNQALVIIPIYTYQDNQGNLVEVYEDHGMMVFYKKDAKIEMNSKDVQGTWLWFMDRNDGQYDVRTAMIFDGDNFDFIIPSWGQRMKGTFTCENGYINFHVTKYLVNEARPCGIDDYKNGYEEPSPNSWNSEPPFGKDFTRLFLPLGDFAFSNVANLPCRLTKQ